MLPCSLAGSAIHHAAHQFRRGAGIDKDGIAKHKSHKVGVQTKDLPRLFDKPGSQAKNMQSFFCAAVDFAHP